MTQDAKQEMKQGLEFAGNWLTRALLGVCIYFLVSMMNEIKDTSSQVQDLKAQVLLMKYQIDDLTRTVRHINRADNE